MRGVVEQEVVEEGHLAPTRRRRRRSMVGWREVAGTGEPQVIRGGSTAGHPGPPSKDSTPLLLRAIFK